MVAILGVEVLVNKYLGVKKGYPTKEFLEFPDGEIVIMYHSSSKYILQFFCTTD
ncbi:MAG: hypothetical protein L0956_06960 [Candidatus Mariimomonas ferrooxydans]